MLLVNTLSIAPNGWLPSDEKKHQDALLKKMEPDFKNMDQEKKDEIMNYYSLANNHFDLIQKKNQISKNTKAGRPTNIHPKCEWYLQTKAGKRIKIVNFCQDCKTIEEKSTSDEYDEEIPVTFPPFISAFLERLDEKGQENLIKGFYYLHLVMVNWMKAGHRLSKEELKHSKEVPLFSSPREKKNLADPPVTVDSVGNISAGRPQLRNQCILLIVLIVLFLSQ